MPARNGHCPCGSGKKYKICCGRLAAVSRSAPGPEAIRTLHALSIDQRHGELEAAAREIALRWPRLGYAWQYLGLALGKQGKDAVPALERAAQCEPDDAVVHVNLGNALGRAGRLEAAAASFSRALTIDAGCAEALNNLADVQIELGHVALAACSARRALEIRPDFADAHWNLGKALASSGHLNGAIESLNCALQLRPHFADALNSLGNALATSGRYEEAIASYRRALEVRPEFHDARFNCASILRRVGRLDEAVSALREALSARPASIPILIELATALRLLGRTGECEAACRTALEHDAECAPALMVLAELHADCGDFHQAEEMFKRVMSRDPRATDAWAELTSVRRMTAADAPWLSQALHLADQPLSPQHEAQLRFAIGKYFDDTEDFDNAFLNYRRANELLRGVGPRHDRDLLTRRIDLIIRSWDRQWVSRRRDEVPRCARAAFIVGTLRSGSSLTEQILSSHPDIYGAGELMFWAEKLGPVVAGAASDEARTIDADDGVFKAWGNGYLELLQRVSDTHRRVIDKLPTNFLFLGPIHASLPEARIIHVHRHPIDTCLSIYFQRFEAANTYVNDLEDLAHSYRQYRRLMRHWRDALPAGTLLDVPYEGLVEDPETWSRRMVEFIGLDWDPRCLDFRGTRRTVRTASRWQVRQQISNRSVGRWRHYEKFVEPLKQLLLDDTGDYG
jgi:tetratricopeptide (TPR) repeat protein